MIGLIMQEYLLSVLTLNALLRFLPKVISVKSPAKNLRSCLVELDRGQASLI